MRAKAALQEADEFSLGAANGAIRMASVDIHGGVSGLNGGLLRQGTHPPWATTAAGVPPQVGQERRVPNIRHTLPHLHPAEDQSVHPVFARHGRGSAWLSDGSFLRRRIVPVRAATPAGVPPRGREADPDAGGRVRKGLSRTRGVVYPKASRPEVARNRSRGQPATPARYRLSARQSRSARWRLLVVAASAGNFL